MGVAVTGRRCCRGAHADAALSASRLFAQGVHRPKMSTTWAASVKPCSAAVRDYLRMKLVVEPNEVFAVVFLDSQHQVLAYEPLFKGTVDQTSVYPRVVVQRALALNASALILAHQHPSGVTEPSAADRALTDRLQTALALVDIRVVDHFVIGKGTPYSFAESGLL